MQSESSKRAEEAISQTSRIDKAENIKITMARSMGALAKKDPEGWLRLSDVARLEEAADLSAKNLVASANKKREKIAQSIIARNKYTRLIDESENPLEALGQLLTSSFTRSGSRSVLSKIQSIRDQAFALTQTVHGFTEGKVLELFQDEKGIAALVKELHGEHSGNTTARSAAKKYREVINVLRARFNEAGGDIDPENWSLPHSHSGVAVLRAGQSWIDAHMRLVDRGQYFSADGARMNDEELRALLAEVQITIATGRAKQIGQDELFGMASCAACSSDAHAIHYKNADSFIEAQKKYSDKNLYDLLLNHLENLATDIVFLETFSANSEDTFSYLINYAEKKAIKKSPGKKSALKRKRAELEFLYQEMTKAGRASTGSLISDAPSFRFLNIAGKMDSAAASFLADMGDSAKVILFGAMPFTSALGKTLKTLNPAKKADREHARKIGIAAEQFIQIMSRFGVDALESPLLFSDNTAKEAQRFTSGMLRLSALDALANATRSAFSVTLLDELGHMSKRYSSMGAMSEINSTRFQNAGITEADFAVWHLARAEDQRGMGDAVLTTKSIFSISDEALLSKAEQGKTSTEKLKEDAALHLYSYVSEKLHAAVAKTGGEKNEDVVHGAMPADSEEKEEEQAGLFWLYRDRAIAVVMNRMTRAMTEKSIMGRAEYLAILIVNLTAMGAIAIQLNNVAKGRDPDDMTGSEFWLAAFLEGGAAGIYGNFLLHDQTYDDHDNNHDFIGRLIDQMISAANDTPDSMTSEPDEETRSEEIYPDTRAVPLTDNHASIINLSYKKAAFDHLIFHHIQEHISPGYLKRLRQRAEKEFDQDFWLASDNEGEALNSAEETDLAVAPSTDNQADTPELEADHAESALISGAG